MDESTVVQTKNLAYSYLTLMPKDRREAKIYYQSKLEEVGDLYFYFLFLQAGLVIVDGIELDKKRDTLSFLILLSTIVVTMVRIFAYT